MVIWITGAPGSGKTTAAKIIMADYPNSVLLDGDEVRKWLTVDCGFSQEDRLKHATRIWKVADLISQVGGIAVVALIAHPPMKVDKLIWVDGPSRRPLWKGTTYIPPKNPDEVINTWSEKFVGYGS